MNLAQTWFRGLRGKLLFSAILPLIAFIALTVLSVRSMNLLGGMLTTAYTDVIPNMDYLGHMGMQRARVGYFIWAALDNKDDLASREKFITRAKSAFVEFKKYQDLYEATNLSPEEEKNYAKTKDAKVKFNAMTEELFALLETGSPEDSKKAYTSMNFGDWHKIAIDVQEGIAANMKYYQEVSAENNKVQIAERTYQTQLLYGISAFCSLAVFGILMGIAYRVSNTITGISSGLTDSGTQVSDAIVQLTSAGQTLSESSTEAAASLEETVASLEEMTSMVRMNSDNAKQAASLSHSSKEAAEIGQNEIQNLIGSMRDISKSSKQIEEIISVIDDIAFQTNLLALNAAVEAARAGEQGKGFAVVAEAVRALAQRSASAAKDINVLIKDSVDKVEKGSSIADKSGEVLANIVNSVKKVSDLNNEIAAASSEQTAGIQQISKAMNQLDQGSQANAASSEEIAASAEEINAQAQQMKNMVSTLNTVVIGSDEQAPPKEVRRPAPSAKVLPLQKKAAPTKVASSPAKVKSESAALIPFDDEDSSRSKVGTTDGF
ncbi:Methyl-accepting chemotaxis protein II [compost metagenome]